MSRTTWLQERRMAKFADVLRRWEHRELSAQEAGELLGCSERQFRRWRRRYEEEGHAGLADRLPWQSVGATCAGRQDHLDDWRVPNPPHGLEREALPRVPAAAIWVRVGLHLDQAAITGSGLGRSCQNAWGASS